MNLSVNIQKQLGDFRLNVQFETDGEILALLGASGCGKSVTLRCIAGIMTPDEGTIVLDGTILYDRAAGINLPPQKRQVGYLFQQYALFPHMNVRQNIAVAAKDPTSVQTLLHRFRLEDISAQKPHQLSGGQQQRTALARILASNPKVILLDEPFSALDNYLQYQLELELTEILEEFSGQVVWVSHDRNEVFRNCKKVCVLDKGCSQGIFTLRELFHHPGTEASARLSGCENYADAVPAESRVYLPQWGLTLLCDRPVPPEIRCVGIRARHVVPAEGTTINTFPCTVLRVIQDIFTTIILLRPDSALPDAPPLRMELPRDNWQAFPKKNHLDIFIQPRDLLLLE